MPVYPHDMIGWNSMKIRMIIGLLGRSSPETMDCSMKYGVLYAKFP